MKILEKGENGNHEGERISLRETQRMILPMLNTRTDRQRKIRKLAEFFIRKSPISKDIFHA